MRRAWPGLLDEVRERSRVTQVLLSSATVHAVEGDTLVLTIASAALARQLSEERHVEKITSALQAVLGGAWRIRCQLADQAGQTGQRPAAAAQPSARQQPQRPSRRIEPPARGRGAANGRGAPPPMADEPPPPEPPDSDPFDDEDAMLAEAAMAPDDAGGRKDPEEAALELLADTLGARKIDEH